MSDLFQYPIWFWLSLLLLLGAGGWGWVNRAKGWGLPAMAVSLTAIAWYHGDAFYNDYSTDYTQAFTSVILREAWLEVGLFALAFAVFVSFIPDFFNGKQRGNSSQVEGLLSGRVSMVSLQPAIEKLTIGLIFVWLVIFGVALMRTNFDVLGLVAPYIKGTMAYPWARGQIAQSMTDSFASLFDILDLVCAAFFGICVALLEPGWLRTVAMLMVALSWPGYLLNRTRNVMLTVFLPGLLTYTFLRLRRRWLLQVALLLVSFLAVNFWFKFVIINRGGWNIIGAVMNQSQRENVNLEAEKHQGFNMFEELCWANDFIDVGTFKPVNGRLYFANFVNPIPRALWPDKPVMLGDYAELRGAQGTAEGGVTTTYCVGMVGSGVVNFGQFFGPIAAAFLMSLWCAALARLDLTGQDLGRLLVYMVGMVLTFNFGRDITFLVAYPFLFAFATLWLWRKISPISQEANGISIVATDQMAPQPLQKRRARSRRRNLPNSMPVRVSPNPSGLPDIRDKDAETGQ